MIHQGSAGFRGNTPDVEIQMREVMHLTERLTRILAGHTGQTPEKVKAIRSATSTWARRRRRPTA
jgi:ATP-dependent Clp protease protease subunit